METNNTTQTIPMSIFVQAACKLFKCKPDAIDIRMIEENQLANVQYKGDLYYVSTFEGLRENVDEMLHDPGYALHIDLSIWITATENTVELGRFLPNLIDKLESVDQAQILQLALTFNSFSTEKDATFWNILAKLDKEGTLLGNAIISTAEIYNGEGLIDDITELMIMEGDRVYNMIEGGIFEQVSLSGKYAGYPGFYIYSVEGSFYDVPDNPKI